MIGYVTLGSNDLQKGAKLYDAIAEEMGVGRMMDFGTFIAWGKMDGPAGVALTQPFNEQPATAGNGTMVALQANDTDQVHRIHAIALEQGGTCEGPPGPRGGDGTDGGFYAGYFRDLDGNKLCAFTMAGGG